MNKNTWSKLATNIGSIASQAKVMNFDRSKVVMQATNTSNFDPQFVVNSTGETFSNLNNEHMDEQMTQEKKMPKLSQMAAAAAMTLTLASS